MPYTKISQEKIDEILQLNAEGKPIQEIAEQVEAARSTVAKYIRKAWPKKREEGEGTSGEVQALLKETLKLLQEQKGAGAIISKKIPYCPRCGYLMHFDFRDENLACIKCGYCQKVQTPSWQRGELVKI